MNIRKINLKYTNDYVSTFLQSVNKYSFDYLLTYFESVFHLLMMLLKDTPNPQYTTES